jgi:hypothetical protein
MIGGAEMRHGRATYGLLSRGALHSPAPWLGLSLQGGREERRLSSRGASVQDSDSAAQEGRNTTVGGGEPQE